MYEDEYDTRCIPVPIFSPYDESNPESMKDTIIALQEHVINQARTINRLCSIVKDLQDIFRSESACNYDAISELDCKIEKHLGSFHSMLIIGGNKDESNIP